VPGVKAVARFMNKETRRPELLFGSGRFRGRRRLTAFGLARNIVRIRTKSAEADDRVTDDVHDASLRFGLPGS
jgi:hypothetical protein